MCEFCHRCVLLPNALAVDIYLWLRSELLIGVGIRILLPFGRWWWELKTDIQFSIVNEHLYATEMWEVRYNEHELGNLYTLKSIIVAHLTVNTLTKNKSSPIKSDLFFSTITCGGSPFDGNALPKPASLGSRSVKSPFLVFQIAFFAGTDKGMRSQAVSKCN
jgi:hypothetical protein